jgi:hypothetical protein
LAVHTLAAAGWCAAAAGGAGGGTYDWRSIGAHFVEAVRCCEKTADRLMTPRLDIRPTWPPIAAGRRAGLAARSCSARASVSILRCWRPAGVIVLVANPSLGLPAVLLSRRCSLSIQRALVMLLRLSLCSLPSLASRC